MYTKYLTEFLVGVTGIAVGSFLFRTPVVNHSTDISVIRTELKNLSHKVESLENKMVEINRNHCNNNTHNQVLIKSRNDIVSY